MFFQNIVAGLVAYFAITCATPVPVKFDTPSVCGSVDLANDATQKLYTGACYELEGVALRMHVHKVCSCEFFPFETCNAVPLVNSVSEDTLQVAKGYFCEEVQRV